MEVAAKNNSLKTVAWYILSLLIFAFPLEHKYDKLFRHFSLKIIPNGISLPEGFEKKIYFYASDIGALLLICLAVFAFKIPWKRLFLQKGTLFLSVIFLSALFSALLSPLAHYPVIYTRLVQLLTPIFLFSFLTTIPLSEQQLRTLMSLFILSALLQSFFALIQYFTQEPLGLRIFAESRDTPAAFSMPLGRRWLFDRLFHYVGPTETIKRASGTLLHSNVLGGLLSLSILASYSFLSQAKEKSRQICLSLLLFIQVFALSLTYSRSAIFGLFVGTAVYFGWAAFHRRLRETRLVAIAFLLSLSCTTLLLFEQYQYRGGLINYNKLVQESDQIRLNAHKTAVQMIEDHPLLGVGYEQFATQSSSYVQPGGETPLAHNIYLFLGAEMGIVGLCAFLAFIGMILLQTIRAPFSFEIASLLGILTMFLFIGCCDFYPVHLQEGKLMFFITAALLYKMGSRKELCPI